MFKGAIFDLDGVIVNTVPVHFKAWKKMFEEYGHPFNFDDYLAKVDGIPRIPGAKAILTELSEEKIIEASNKKQTYFREFLDSEPIEIFESSVKLIKEMKQKGVKLAAASSSKNATFILEKIELMSYFDANVSGGDLKKGKPDPEIFLSAAQKMGCDPSECIVFEDAKLGVEAAVRGSFACIGINRHDNAEALKKADIVLNDLSETSLDEIIKIVERKQKNG
ncbi:MAG: beta-phosphoglucomutase family hydrolase [Candidatus Saganbacteria bacterium]|nr:beta-phosphoglucomutase family hydrolase [Candidatus Saganbacteria bacterium]